MTAHEVVSPGHRLAERCSPVVERMLAELDRHLPPGTTPDRERRRRRIRLTQALAACTNALTTGDHPRPVRAGSDTLETSVITMLTTELVEAVGDHPDRTRLIADGVAAIHRSLYEGPEEVVGDPADEPETLQAHPDRERLAREVHDWVGNGVSLALRQLEMHGIDTSRGSPDAAARRVEQARATLEELLFCTRRLVADLRGVPWVADLDDAVRGYVARIGSTGVRTTVEIDTATAELPASVRDELFVVLREALRNVYAHAVASHADVVVDVTDGRIVARVDDDGIGIARSGRDRGAGLVLMQGRVEDMGGRVAVSTREPGTRVEVTLDLTRLPEAYR